MKKLLLITSMFLLVVWLPRYCESQEILTIEGQIEIRDVDEYRRQNALYLHINKSKKGAFPSTKKGDSIFAKQSEEILIKQSPKGRNLIKQLEEIYGGVVILEGKLTTATGKNSPIGLELLRIVTVVSETTTEIRLLGKVIIRTHGNDVFGDQILLDCGTTKWRLLPARNRKPLEELAGMQGQVVEIVGTKVIVPDTQQMVLRVCGVCGVRARL